MRGQGAGAPDGQSQGSARSAKRGGFGPGARALVSGACELHGRGHGRIASARRARRDRGRAGGAWRFGFENGRARRIHAARFRERQARSDRSGGSRGPYRCRDGGAAESGALASGRGVAGALRGLAGVALAGHGICGSVPRLFGRGRYRGGRLQRSAAAGADACRGARSRARRWAPR